MKTLKMLLHFSVILIFKKMKRDYEHKYNLALRIPPLLLLEKRKLGNDVDYKIDKLSPEPSCSRQG